MGDKSADTVGGVGRSEHAQDVIRSASQIEDFLLCRRKWAFNKIDKIKQEGTPATQLGGDTHKELEHYYEGGDIRYHDEFGHPYLPGEIAASGLEHLPAPGTPGLKVEGYFKFQTPGGHWVRGYKDLEILQDGQVPAVYDHKTASQFGSYNKTEETLKDDTQANLYAYETMLKTGSDVVDLQWTYMRTKGARKSKAVRLRVFRQDVENKIKELDEVMSEMHSINIRCQTANEVEKNIDACRAFGGCPYINICHQTPAEKMRSLMGTSKDTDSLLKNLGNRSAVNPPDLTKAERSGADIFASILGKPEVSSPLSEDKAPEEVTPEEPSVPLEETTRGEDTDYCKIGTLYLSCYPNHSDGVVELADIIQIAQEWVSKEHNVADYRLIPYGQGAAHLVRHVVEHLKKGHIEELFADLRAVETSVVLTALIDRSYKVVRGL